MQQRSCRAVTALTSVAERFSLLIQRVTSEAQKEIQQIMSPVIKYCCINLLKSYKNEYFLPARCSLALVQLTGHSLFVCPHRNEAADHHLQPGACEQRGRQGGAILSRPFTSVGKTYLGKQKEPV